MKKNIQAFLNELYAIDPSLKEKEAQLEKIIATMTALSPDVKMDENFKTNLRLQIAQTIQSEKLKNYQVSSKPNLLQIISYVFGWVGVAAFGFFIFQDQFISNKIVQTPVTEESQTVQFKSTVVQAQANSFWKLNTLWIDGNAKGWAVREMANVASIAGDVAVSAPAPESAPQALPASEMAVSDLKTENIDIAEAPPSDGNMRSSKMMIAWDAMIAPVDPNYVPEVYRYTFSGSLDLEIPQNLTVYKKDTTKTDTSSLVNILKGVNFNWVDLGNFSNLALSNISLNENKDFGYSLYMDFDGGNLSLSKNWTKWPQVNFEEIQKAPVIQEDEAKKIASDFLKQYNIDLSSYGNPVIEQNYMMALAKMSARIAPDFYTPTPTVIYPLVIDGKEVKEEYGQYAWVRIEIDAQSKKVSSINGMSVATYIASQYQVENNVENILKVANVWGRYGFYDMGTDNVKITNIALKNPKLTYINTYNYKNNIQEQFVIPAIIFEVEKPENTEYFYQETITVPLLKDFYKYDEKWMIIGQSEQ